MISRTTGTLLVLLATALAEEFVISADNSNGCPDGYVSVKDEESCKRAMTALGRSPWGRSDTWNDHPGGCFNNPNGVFFNVVDGSSKAGRAPICVKAEAKLVEEFVQGADNTNVCPDSYAKITDEDTCKRAVPALKKSAWGRKDEWTDHPGGCFDNPTGVFFNALAGSIKVGRSPICVRSIPEEAVIAVPRPAEAATPAAPQLSDPAQPLVPGEPAKPAGTPWPDCQEKNTVIRNGGQALFADLQAYGAAIGCYLDDCVYTDKFVGAEIESCTSVCHSLPNCKHWVWGMEDGEQKCWFRTGDAGREFGEAWVTGSKTCVPPGTQVLPLGNDECWTEGFGYPECCDDKFGPNGNAQCWDGVFNYDRCCFPKDEL